jgi:hypothetical protein
MTLHTYLPVHQFFLPYSMLEIMYTTIVFWLISQAVLVSSFIVQPRMHNPSSVDTSFNLCSAKAPVYITIGPQCAGKTTLLSQLEQRIKREPSNKILDISIDDQEGVYIPVKVQYFLHPSTPKPSFWNRHILGKTMRRRIDEQIELSAIIQRLGGRISAADFERNIVQLYRNHTIETLTRKDPNRTITNNMIRNDFHTQIAQDLIEAVQSIQQCSLPNTIQLFVVEALFRPNSVHNVSAVDSAITCFQNAVTSSDQYPVAWGNTNTRPRDYSTALAAAESGGRPVFFLLYGNPVQHPTLERGSIVSLVPWKVLVKRNIQRFLKTGKYVPIKGIWESSVRVENLVQTVVRDIERYHSNYKMDPCMNDNERNPDIPLFSRWDVDRALAKLANYEMAPDRTVRFIATSIRRSNSPKRNKNEGIQSSEGAHGR